MALKSMALNSNITSGTPGTYLTTNSNGSVYWSTQEDRTISEFIEFTLEIMGIDLTFSEFKSMSKSDRVAFIRDLRIDSVLKGKEM